MSITSNSCTTDNTISNSNYSNFNTATSTTTAAYPNWNYTTTSTSTIYSSFDDYLSRIIELEKYVEKEKKEKGKMDTNFKFGPYNSSDVRLSIYGIAIKNKDGKWVSYDKNTHKLIDVEVLNVSIEASKIFYKLPKAINQVIPGDIIIHNGKPVFVEEVRNDGKFEVIDPSEGVVITILPLNSPFGFNFTECLVSITDCMPAADENNPFGNLLPLIIAGNGDNNALAMAMMMSETSEIDPMMMLLMNGKDNNLSTFLLMQMMKKDKKKKKKETKIEENEQYYIQL